MDNPRTDSFDYEDVLKIANGEMFGPGVPSLPTPPMLMLDRVTTITNGGGKYDKGYIEAELDVRPDLWFFDCHFKNDPVMPGCLGLDAMWQLTGLFLGWNARKGKGRALGCKAVSFTGQVLPDAKLVKYRIDIKRVIDRRLIMIITDGTMSVDGEQIYTAEDLRVGLFKEGL